MSAPARTGARLPADMLRPELAAYFVPLAGDDLRPPRPILRPAYGVLGELAERRGRR